LIPGKVVRTFKEHDVLMGKVDFGGVSKQVCLEHVSDVQIGQYVLVHVGFALPKSMRTKPSSFSSFSRDESAR
jgi:hydrogenase expression/formation protein HypC